MKTKLGISVGLLGAILYLAGFISGILALALVAGYILIAESDTWLRKTAVKAVVFTLAFSVLSLLIGFIPDLLNLVDATASIFGGYVNIPVISEIIYWIQLVLSIVEKVLTLILAYLALSGRTLRIPFVDKFVDKYMGDE